MNPRASDIPLELPPLIALEASRDVEAVNLEEEVLALFDALRDPLFRYVCTFGIGVEDAEDVVQDAFLALFKHLRRRGARTNLRGWLFRVAHNLALKRRIQRRREQERHEPGATAAFVFDQGQDPEERLASLQQRIRAHAVLRALPRIDRSCLLLRSSGLRYREIAHVLGISLGGVAKSLTRSLARLQCATEG
jgi:RNA polymerase sigma-70 factor (ECF subfamily)